MPQRSEPSAPERQQPLQQRYRDEPQAAWIGDRARAVVGAGTDPFHGEVEPANNGGGRWAYGIHRAVGGGHDAPNPGDLLCAALAACLHSTTRILAEWHGIELLDAEVTATAEVDVRGALMVDASVPVGFQRLRCAARLEVPAGTDRGKLEALTSGAEHCCVVRQTLSRGIDVQTDWQIDRARGGC